VGSFYAFLSETGVRIGEALELRFGDVDFGRRRLKIERQFYRGRERKPKGRKRRTIPISRALAQDLWARQGAPEELLFTSERGKRLDQSNLMSRVLKPAAVRAGVGEWVKAKHGLRAETWVGHHTFRHSCATRLFRSGWNAVQVQKFLGHTDPGFTLRTYVHLLDEDLPEPPAVGNKGATRAAETDRNGRSRSAPFRPSEQGKHATGRDRPKRRLGTHNPLVPGSNPGGRNRTAENRPA
jgi:integrase